ncbi:hypothetical protein D3C80_1950070 [compost metagenome]
MNITSIADITIDLRTYTIYILHGFEDIRCRILFEEGWGIHLNEHRTIDLGYLFHRSGYYHIIKYCLLLFVLLHAVG